MGIQNMTLDELHKILAADPDKRVNDFGAGIVVTDLPRVTRVTSPSEHDEQVALFQWAAANEAAHPELTMIFAIPNGGLRHPAVAAMLRQEGVKAGVPDICLPVARGKWHGLFLELKRCDHSNNTTDLQDGWIARLRQFNYCAVVAYGANEAIQAIMSYLAQE